jgi:hypothetical protein
MKWRNIIQAGSKMKIEAGGFHDGQLKEKADKPAQTMRTQKGQKIRIVLGALAANSGRKISKATETQSLTALSVAGMGRSR